MDKNLLLVLVIKTVFILKYGALFGKKVTISCGGLILLLCADMKPLDCLWVGLRSSSLNVAMIGVIPSSSISAHSVKRGHRRR